MRGHHDRSDDCGARTPLGLALASPNPDAFEPEGTPAMWFWLAWPVGGLICGIVAVLWDAFGKQNDQMG